MKSVNQCLVCKDQRYIKSSRTILYCGADACRCRDDQQKTCKHFGAQVSTCWVPCPKCGDPSADELPTLRVWSEQGGSELRPLEILKRRQEHQDDDELILF